MIVAISDGDNLALPTARYPTTPFWQATGRGSIPLGWSINPALAYLAPAVWDYYATTATPNDEPVPVIGYGYVAANQLPDPLDFYRTSFQLGRELGMTSYWSFFSGADWGATDQYPLIDAAAGNRDPSSVLVGYYQYLGGPIGTTPAGRPVFNAIGSGYTDTPAQIADKIRALTAVPPALRQPVYFISASAWTTDAQGLVDQLAPLAGNGVRFLTPTDAAACRTNNQ